MTVLRLLVTASLAALLVPAAASSSAQETRPYKATCTAIPEDPLSPHVRATGSCQATHFGRDVLFAEHNVVPTGPPDASGMLPIAVVGGQSHARRAERRRGPLRLRRHGRVDLATGRIEFELAGHYTGGTGRFANASGTTRIRGVVENGVAQYSEEGSITY